MAITDRTTTEGNQVASTDESQQVTDPTAQQAALDTSQASTEAPVSADSTQDTVAAPSEGDQVQAGEDNVAADDADLDDETINALAEAYGDRLLGSEKIQERLRGIVQQQVQEQVRQRTRSLEGQDEVSQMITRGKTAVDSINQLAATARDELHKAASDQTFSAEVFKPEALMQHLSDYGQAIVAELGSRYDGAIQESLEQNLGRLPALSDAQQQEFLQIVSQAQRMELDPRQAANSKAYFISAVTGFLVNRAYEAGAVAARDQLVKDTAAKRKLTEKAVVNKAAAQIAKTRGNIPPKTPASAPAESRAPTGNYDSDYYRQLKKEGKHSEAQAYVNQFGRGRVTVTP